MNDKTSKALATSISELAKAITRLAAASERQSLSVRYVGGAGYPLVGYPDYGSGGTGGNPGGVHPVTTRPGSGAGGAALSIVTAATGGAGGDFRAAG